MFMIAPSHPWWKEASAPGRPVPEGFRYASETNTSWLTAEELRQLAGIPAPEEAVERGRSESLRRLQEALSASKPVSPAQAPIPVVVPKS
jgi:hypothetical protein